jgi:tripartite motif-containing protein 71
MNRPAIRACAIILLALLLGLAGRGAQAATPPTFALKWTLPPPPSFPTPQEHDLAVDALGHVRVIHNGGVETYDANGNLLARFGSFGSAPGQFNGPYGIGLDSGGNVYVAEIYSHRVQKLTASGTPLLAIGTFGSGDGQFNTPVDVAARSDGSIYVADAGNNRVQKFDAAGNYVAEWNSFLGEPLASLYAIAADAYDNVYILDATNGRIVQLGPGDAFVRAIPVPMLFALGMAVAPSRHFLLSDSENGTVYVYDAGGAFLYNIGSPGSGDGQFFSPQGVVEDAIGDVYVSDRYRHTIQKFVPPSPTPARATSWGRVKALYR